MMTLTYLKIPYEVKQLTEITGNLGRIIMDNKAAEDLAQLVHGFENILSSQNFI